MGRNRLRLAILGIPVFFITIFINFPAEPIAEILREKTFPGLNWRSMKGSIFNVEIIGLSMKTDPGRIYRLDKLVLQTSVLRLFTGSVFTEVTAQIQNSQIGCDLILNQSQWHINKISGLIQLDELYSQFPELALIGVSGELNLSGDNLAGQYNELPSTGNLDVRLKNMMLGIVSTASQLGNYQLAIEKIDYNRILGKLDMLEGDSQLYIMADAILNKVDKVILIQGYAWAGMDAEEQVNELLPLIGNIDNGRAQINWRTRF
jgi:hypothetical protein